MRHSISNVSNCENYVITPFFLSVSFFFFFWQNKMETSDGRRFGVTGRSRQLCCIPKIIRWSTVHWRMAVCRGSCRFWPRTASSTTIRRRFILSPSGRRSTSKTITISFVSECSGPGLVGRFTRSKCCSILPFVCIQLVVVAQQLLSEQRGEWQQ